MIGTDTDSYWQNNSIGDAFASDTGPAVGPTRESAKVHRAQHDQSVSYDITNNYDWTAIPTGSKYREEAPSAYITAYQLEYGQLQQMVDGYINIATANKRAKTRGIDPGMEFYRNIYKPKDYPIGHFNFPFFSDDIRSFTTEYEDTFSKISQRGAKFLGATQIEGLAGYGEKILGGGVALAREAMNMGGNAVSDKIAGSVTGANEWVGQKMEDTFGIKDFKFPGLQTVGAPGNYIETPMFYQYANTDAPLDISFVLSNTINGEPAYLKNHDFITEFTKMNRPRRMGAIGMTFPAIYHIEVPGLRYIEWAYLVNFSISMLGTRRKLETSAGSMILPEAFRCGFQFRSLTVEAANFMDQVDKIAPYDNSDAGYKALRARADEARKQSQDEIERDQLRKSVKDERSLSERLEEDPNFVPEYGSDAYYNLPNADPRPAPFTPDFNPY